MKALCKKPCTYEDKIGLKYKLDNRSALNQQPLNNYVKSLVRFSFVLLIIVP
jgi:hypothetical protein